jgi:hypothetical protein
MEREMTTSMEQQLANALKEAREAVDALVDMAMDVDLPLLAAERAADAAWAALEALHREACEENLRLTSEVTATRNLMRGQKKYPEALVKVREVARAMGYAVGVHGSETRDLDLIAAPWRGDAKPAHELAEAVRAVLEGEFSITHDQPDVKPAGRLAWSIQIGGGAYIDLSVMPTDEAAERANVRVLFAEKDLAAARAALEKAEREMDDLNLQRDDAMSSEAVAQRLLRNLVESLDRTHDDPRYWLVWSIAQSHAGPYRGPTYTDELIAAREYLDALDAGDTSGSHITAPWTEEQVVALNRYQVAENVHPYTCANGCGDLIATTSGWKCCRCNYTQTWALEGSLTFVKDTP